MMADVNVRHVQRTSHELTFISFILADERKKKTNMLKKCKFHLQELPELKILIWLS